MKRSHDNLNFSFTDQPSLDDGQVLGASIPPKTIKDKLSWDKNKTNHNNDTVVDPESAYIASLASCHMLSFLAEATKQGVKVMRYTDHAVGVLSKNSYGRIAVTKALLRPEIEFNQGSTISDTALHQLHRQAHKNCFIANSVNTEIVIESKTVPN